jgi:hypothetical protein
MEINWQAVSLVVVWSGFLIGVIKFLLVRVTRDIDKRLDSISASQAEESREWQRVERDLMQLRADMPLHYVRREDYIRGQSVIEAKLDALASKLELTRIQGAKHDH